MADQKSIERVEEAEVKLPSDMAVSDNPITVYRTYSAAQAAAIEKRLVRKLDTRILPVIVLIYILNYVRIPSHQSDTIY